MSTDTRQGLPEYPDEPVHVEDESHLEALIAGNEVVLVDYFATWCGPCQMIEPILEDLADRSDVVIAKVDVDEHQSLAATQGVRSVPTLLLHVEGEQVEERIGAPSADELQRMLDQYLD